MSTVETIYTLINQSLKESCLEFNHKEDHPCIKIKTDSLIRVMTVLRDHPQTKCTQLSDIVVIDTPKNKKRFRIVYPILSYSKNFRVYIQIQVAEDEAVSSLTSIFACAGWYEREAWDLFGIHFQDNTDLRRILTDYNFSGHPMRKDFPLYGYSQVRYDEEQRRVVYEPINMMQEYRDFDFKSPWEGNWQKLLKAEETSAKE